MYWTLIIIILILIISLFLLYVYLWPSNDMESSQYVSRHNAYIGIGTTNKTTYIIEVPNNINRFMKSDKVYSININIRGIEYPFDDKSRMKQCVRSEVECSKSVNINREFTYNSQLEQRISPTIIPDDKIGNSKINFYVKDNKIHVEIEPELRKWIMGSLDVTLTTIYPHKQNIKSLKISSYSPNKEELKI